MTAFGVGVISGSGAGTRGGAAARRGARCRRARGVGARAQPPRLLARDPAVDALAVGALVAAHGVARAAAEVAVDVRRKAGQRQPALQDAHLAPAIARAQHVVAERGVGRRRAS